MQGARRGTRSRDPGVTPWAEGRCSTAEPPRDPPIFLFKRAEPARCHQANTLAGDILHGSRSQSLAFVIFSQIPHLCGRLVLWLGSRGSSSGLRTGGRRGCAVDSWPRPRRGHLGVLLVRPGCPLLQPCPLCWVTEVLGSQGPWCGLGRAGLRSPAPGAEGGRSEPAPPVGKSRCLPAAACWLLSRLHAGLGRKEAWRQGSHPGPGAQQLPPGVSSSSWFDACSPASCPWALETWLGALVPLGS